MDVPPLLRDVAFNTSVDLPQAYVATQQSDTTPQEG